MYVEKALESAIRMSHPSKTTKLSKEQTTVQPCWRCGTKSDYHTEFCIEATNREKLRLEEERKRLEEEKKRLEEEKKRLEEEKKRREEEKKRQEEEKKRQEEEREKEKKRVKERELKERQRKEMLRTWRRKRKEKLEEARKYHEMSKIVKIVAKSRSGRAIKRPKVFEASFKEGVEWYRDQSAIEESKYNEAKREKEDSDDDDDIHHHKKKRPIQRELKKDKKRKKNEWRKRKLNMKQKLEETRKYYEMSKMLKIVAKSRSGRAIKRPKVFEASFKEGVEWYQDQRAIEESKYNEASDDEDSDDREEKRAIERELNKEKIEKKIETRNRERELKKLEGTRKYDEMVSKIPRIVAKSRSGRAIKIPETYVASFKGSVDWYLDQIAFQNEKEVSIKNKGNSNKSSRTTTTTAMATKRNGSVRQATTAINYANEMPQKRKRGRPRKHSKGVAEQNANGMPPKRSRGRSRKDPEVVVEQNKLTKKKKRDLPSERSSIFDVFSLRKGRKIKHIKRFGYIDQDGHSSSSSSSTSSNNSSTSTSRHMIAIPSNFDIKKTEITQRSVSISKLSFRDFGVLFAKIHIQNPKTGLIEMAEFTQLCDLDMNIASLKRSIQEQFNDLIRCSLDSELRLYVMSTLSHPIYGQDGTTHFCKELSNLMTIKQILCGIDFVPHLLLCPTRISSVDDDEKEKLLKENISTVVAEEKEAENIRECPLNTIFSHHADHYHKRPIRNYKGISKTKRRSVGKF